MTDDPPSPPATLPAELVDALADATPEQLRAVSRHAEALAEHKAREARLTDAADDADAAERPDGVPAKASTTIKEINGNRYYYWQWREGETVRSQYKGPVANEE